MDTLLIELTSDKAEKLIRDLEDLKIIKILERDLPKEKLSDKFRASLNLTEQEYNHLHRQLTDMRNEWQ